MTREEVIKGLECCMSGQLDGLGCSRVPCPYNQFMDCEGILHRDALALLKKQEPVKPVFERTFISNIEIYDCGKCGTSLGAKGIAKYCMNCGQAVKWE